jgi:hypothetical protein
VRDVQSGPPLGPSRSKGSEAGCRLSSSSRRRSKCPTPRFIRGGRAAGRRRSVPNGDSRREGVAESSRSTRARRGSVDVSVVKFGDLLGSKRRSKPSKMSYRSAPLRTCFPTASGRQSFPGRPGSPGSAETRTTLGPNPIALPRAADQTPGLSQAVDEVTSSKTRSDQQKPTVAGRRTPSTERPSISQLSAAPWMSGTAPVGLSVTCSVPKIHRDGSHGRQPSRRRLRAHAATNRRFQLHAYRNGFIYDTRSSGKRV